MQKSLPKKSPIWIKTTVLFTFIFVCGMVVSALACYFFYQHTKNGNISRTRSQIAVVLHNTHQHTRRILSMVITDLEFLAGQNELRAYLETGATAVQAALGTEYHLFAEKKRIYDQVRFLDRDGREVVRVNYNEGRPMIVPRDQLQLKQQRYYFKDVKSADPGTIYISEFDLNIENGEIERPIKPIIRFSTPVFSADQAFQGVVVLNCLGQYIIDEILGVSDQNTGALMLVDSDGYWLSSPNREDEWGFMLSDRADKRFGIRFPEAWARISAATRSQFISANGLFTSETFSIIHSTEEFTPYRIANNSRAKDLKIISFLPLSVLDQRQEDLKFNLIILWTVMALISIAPCWMLASSLVRRRLSREQLWQMATYDTLTGLFNRHSFKRILDQIMDESQRYDRCFAIFFIDLDGFKSVNDHMGHDAGDMVLQQAAKRMGNCLRSTDRLARLGGDEFCAIILEVDSREKASQIAQKLIRELKRPFDLKAGTGQIGASIGIALFPWDGRNSESLVKSADTAMYTAKSEGKGKFRFAV